MKFFIWINFLLSIGLSHFAMAQPFLPGPVEEVRPILKYLERAPYDEHQVQQKDFQCETEKNEKALSFFTVHENGKCSLNIWNLYDLSQCKGSLYENQADIKKTMSGRIFCLLNALRKSGGTNNPELQNFLEKFWFSLMPENSFSWFIGSDLQEGVLPKENVLQAIDKLMEELEKRSITEHNSKMYQEELLKKNRKKTKISTQDYINNVIIPRLNLNPSHCYAVSMKTPPAPPGAVLMAEGMEILEPVFSSFLPKILTQKGISSSESGSDPEACKISKEEQDRQFGDFYRGQIIGKDKDKDWNPKGKEAKSLEQFFENYATGGSIPEESINARFLLEVRQQESCPRDGAPSMAYIYECNLMLTQADNAIDFGCQNLQTPDTYLVSDEKYYNVSTGINQLIFKEMMSGGDEYLPQEALYFNKEIRDYFEKEVIAKVFSEENCRQMIADQKVLTDEATVLKACNHFRSKANLQKMLDMGIQFPSASLVEQEYNLKGENSELALKNAMSFYEQITGDPHYLNLSSSKNQQDYTLYAGKGDKDIAAAFDAIQKFAGPEPSEDIMLPLAQFFYERNDPNLRRFKLQVSQNVSINMDFSDDAKGDPKDLQFNRSGLMHPPSFFKEEEPKVSVSGFKQKLHTTEYGDSFYIDSRKEETKTPLPAADWEKLQSYIKYQLADSMEAFAPFMIDAVAMGKKEKQKEEIKE